MRQTCSHILPSLAILLAALGPAISPAAAQGPPLEYETWFVDNNGDPCWGQPGAYIEPMWPALDFQFEGLSVCALDAENPYLAISPTYERTLYGCHFWAEIWLANHVEPTAPQRVDAELWTGYDVPVAHHASASVMVTNGPPGAKYTFDFGNYSEFGLILTKLWLKIIYYGPAGDTHVYWDDATAPTALRVEGTVIGVESQTWGTVKSLYRE